MQILRCIPLSNNLSSIVTGGCVHYFYHSTFCMKKTFLGFIIFIVLFAGLSQCKKSLDPNSVNNPGGSGSTTLPGTTDTTKPSAIGTPTGPTVTQSIGASGGTITTSDGRMELDIPAGALSQNTNITIQNITNSMVTGIGDAYNMSPDHLKFAQPVTFKFHYADGDVDGSAPDFLDIAYQDSAGFWKGIPVNNLDTTNHFVTVQTNHFTNYAEYKLLALAPVKGDLIGNSKLFVNKRETYILYGSEDNNVGNMAPLATGVGGIVQNAWLVNDILGGNSELGTADEATPASSGFTASSGISNYVSCTYIAPATVPSKDENPVKLSTLALIPVNIIRYMFTGKNGSRKSVKISTSIKILDYNVYRLDIVDYNSLGCGNVINYYDSSDIFFRVGPGEADSYDIPQDSIENFPPGASPTTNTCGICSYAWTAEPIGSVNISSANVTFSGQLGSYFVELTLTESGENGVWYTETCAGSTGTVTQKPTFPAQKIPIPISINTSEAQLDTLIEGTPDKSLIRLVLVRNGMN